MIRRRRADWSSIRSRVSRINYLGATYQYQRLLSYPAPGTNETQTHALLLFYTVYPTKRFSISVFGGPQYAEVGPQFSDATSTPPHRRLPKLEPVGGRQFELAGAPEQPGHQLRASDIERRRVDRGGENGQRQRIDTATTRRTLSATVAGGYAENDLLAAAPLTNGNGHTISGTASLQQQFGEHLNVQLGYTRLHQDYARRRPGRDSRHQSRIRFNFLSVLQTAGKVIYG